MRLTVVLQCELPKREGLWRERTCCVASTSGCVTANLRDPRGSGQRAEIRRCEVIVEIGKILSIKPWPQLSSPVAGMSLPIPDKKIRMRICGGSI